MRTVLQVSLLAFCLALTSAEYSQGLLSRSADLSLMQFMVRTRDLSQGNSARSMDCFTYYVPVLNEITAEYEASFARCLAQSEQQRDGIDDSTQDDRDDIERAANYSCQVLNQCSLYKDAIPYFECYVGAGSENSKTMYTISANASSVLAQVREEYRRIDNEEYICTNKSERVYVENTTYTYDQLQSCLQGKSPVPSPPPSPTTTPAPPSTSPLPTSPSTETPETSSAPETETPETSSAPETESPETTTETPEEGPSTTELPETESTPTTEDPEVSTTEEPETSEEPETPKAVEDIRRRSRESISKYLQGLRKRIQN